MKPARHTRSTCVFAKLRDERAIVGVARRPITMRDEQRSRSLPRARAAVPAPPGSFEITTAIDGAQPARRRSHR